MSQDPSHTGSWKGHTQLPVTALLYSTCDFRKSPCFLELLCLQLEHGSMPGLSSSQGYPKHTMS